MQAIPAGLNNETQMCLHKQEINVTFTLLHSTKNKGRKQGINRNINNAKITL